MKAIRKLQISFFLLVLTAGLFSCSDSKDDGYSGNNLIYITTEQDPVIIESDATILTADLTLTRAYEKSVSFEINVKNLTSDEENLVVVTPSTVTIEPGKKNVSFQIVSSQKEILKGDAQLEVSVKSLPESDMEVKQKLTIRMKPSLRNPELTEAQKTLLEGYKTKGLDLSKWIGVIPVKVSVKNTPNDYYDALIENKTFEYTGKTVITLSDKATADQPVLKMIENPMGLAGYIYWLYRTLTINDKGFFLEKPDVKELLALLNYTEDSKETFNMFLDDIRIMAPENDKADINFISEKEDMYGDLIQTVFFKFDYSLWNRMKVKIDEENQLAVDCGADDRTLDPQHHLFVNDVSYDWWEDANNFIEPKGTLDIAGNKMTFIFCFDYNNAQGYNQASVEFTLPE